MDEKQDNCNELVNDLKAVGEGELADAVRTANESIRGELRPIYQDLPRCVFQGDESFSNLCVDDENTLIGLFDFNMAGTEVIANYLANIAFQGNFYYRDEIFDEHSAQEIYNMILNAYRENTELIHRLYQFTGEEDYAYRRYSKLVILFGYGNQYAYSEYGKTEKYRAKCVELLWLLLNTDF